MVLNENVIAPQNAIFCVISNIVHTFSNFLLTVIQSFTKLGLFLPELFPHMDKVHIGFSMTGKQSDIKAKA
jgi:hypothetical protein